MKHLKALAFFGFAFLPACGDRVGLFKALDLRDRTIGYAAQSNRLFAKPGSAFDAVPAFGTATYRGGAGISIATPPSPTALQGEAEIVVNFADRSLSGQVTDIYGFNRNRDLLQYRGGVTLSAGRFQDAPSNRVTIAYRGTLLGQGDVITLDGTLPGIFRATPIAGITFQDKDATADINGITYDLVFGIAAD